MFNMKRQMHECVHIEHDRAPPFRLTLLFQPAIPHFKHVLMTHYYAMLKRSKFNNVKFSLLSKIP